jgi:hypothetical protein
LSLWRKLRSNFSDDPQKAADMGESGAGDADGVCLGIELDMNKIQKRCQIRQFIRVADDQ